MKQAACLSVGVREISDSIRERLSSVLGVSGVVHRTDLSANGILNWIKGHYDPPVVDSFVILMDFDETSEKPLDEASRVRFFDLLDGLEESRLSGKTRICTILELEGADGDRYEIFEISIEIEPFDELQSHRKLTLSPVHGTRVRK